MPQRDAVGDCTRILGDLLKNEETRFSNLNTRAMNLVSATSLITALTGFFARELSTSSLKGWQRGVGSVGLIIVLVLLAITAWITVVHVLNPGRRYLLGNNAILENSDQLATPEDVNLVAYSEYKVTYYGLAGRNREKARHLDLTYKTLHGAVITAGLTLIAILLISIG